MPYSRIICMVCRNNDDGIKSQVSVSKKICFRGIQNDNDASFHYFHCVYVYLRKCINFYCNTTGNTECAYKYIHIQYNKSESNK